MTNYQDQYEKLVVEQGKIQHDLSDVTDRLYICECLMEVYRGNKVVLTETNKEELYKAFKNLKTSTTSISISFYQDHTKSSDDVEELKWEADHDYKFYEFQVTDIMESYYNDYKEDIDGDHESTHFKRTYDVTVVQKQ